MTLGTVEEGFFLSGDVPLTRCLISAQFGPGAYITLRRHSSWHMLYMYVISAEVVGVSYSYLSSMHDQS